MYVRLAFAVAAHLEPEILIVDEVLAVGDAEFQKKCLGKMAEVAGGGRTVLFVSHNMAAIEALCPRSIYLAAGALVSEGNTGNVIMTYLEQRQATSRAMQGATTRIHEDLTIESIISTPSMLRSGEPMEIVIRFRAAGRGQIHECAVLVYNQKGVRVAVVDIR